MKKVKTQPDIYKKYEHWTKQAELGYVTHLDYTGIMEILRYVESKTKRTIPLNIQCSSCVLDLFRLFKSVRDK